MAHQKNTFRMDSLRDSMHAGKSFESEMNHEKKPKKKTILHPLCSQHCFFQFHSVRKLSPC